MRWFFCVFPICEIRAPKEVFYGLLGLALLRKSSFYIRITDVSCKSTFRVPGSFWELLESVFRCFVRCSCRGCFLSCLMRWWLHSGPLWWALRIQRTPKISPKSLQNGGYSSDAALGSILIPFWEEIGGFGARPTLVCWAQRTRFNKSDTLAYQRIRCCSLPS